MNRLSVNEVNSFDRAQCLSSLYLLFQKHYHRHLYYIDKSECYLTLSRDKYRHFSLCYPDYPICYQSLPIYYFIDFNRSFYRICDDRKSSDSFSLNAFRQYQSFHFILTLVIFILIQSIVKV